MPALPQQSSCSAGSASVEFRDRPEHPPRRGPHPLRVEQVAGVLEGDAQRERVPLRARRFSESVSDTTSETSRTLAENAAARSA